MIVIDPSSPVPPYEQLRLHLARQINDRTLAVGARLPTIRHLAADLGLAVNTVARAYRELEDAGLIETRGRGGSFVSAAGQAGRERARRAAADYAAVITSLGYASAVAIASTASSTNTNSGLTCADNILATYRMSLPTHPLARSSRRHPPRI